MKEVQLVRIFYGEHFTYDKYAYLSTGGKKSQPMENLAVFFEVCLGEDAIECRA
jgi:hypothetical protein